MSDFEKLVNSYLTSSRLKYRTTTMGQQKVPVFMINGVDSLLMEKAFHLDSTRKGMIRLCIVDSLNDIDNVVETNPNIIIWNDSLLNPDWESIRDYNKGERFVWLAMGQDLLFKNLKK